MKKENIFYVGFLFRKADAKVNKHKEQMNKFKNYECDGQLCFVDIEMNIAEEPKKNHEQQSA